MWEERDLLLARLLECKTFKDAAAALQHLAVGAARSYRRTAGPEEHFLDRQDPGSAYAAAVPIFIDKAAKNEPITIFGDGEQTRDFIYVKDIVAANVFLAMNETPSGFYNVAYGGRLTINDLARKIIELTGSSSNIEYQPERAGDVKHSMASVEKITAAGFKATSNFEEGLQATIDFFQTRG